jgi:transglutaminase-like putative cysteine protease
MDARIAMPAALKCGVVVTFMSVSLAAGCAARPGSPPRLVFAAAGAGAGATTAPAEAVPTPSTDRVRYDQPERYLVLDPSFGDPQRIRRAAGPLKGATAEASLKAIDAWMRHNLSCDPSLCYAWRNFDDVERTRAFGGCADYAIAFAALARACGVPAVFVKTMDADWIREFRAAGTCRSWRGHVFLEVYVDGRWRLLEPSAMTLYDDYQTTARVLPGNRWAYDKGGDPQALLLSLDWERWKVQTAAHFRNFDLGRLPVSGPGRRLAATAVAATNPARRGRLYVAANSPVWQALERRARDEGFGFIQSFNSDFDKFLPNARGADLVLTCVGARLVLPADHHAELLPVPYAEIQARMKKDGPGTARKTLADGTRVTLVYGRDVEAVLNVVETLKLAP